MNPPLPTLPPWLAPFAWLAAEAALVILAATAAQPFLRSATARRSLWRAAFVALALLCSAEFTGLTSQTTTQLRAALEPLRPRPAPIPAAPVSSQPFVLPPPITLAPTGGADRGEAEPAPTDFQSPPEPSLPPAPIPLSPAPTFPPALFLLLAGTALLLARLAFTQLGFALLRLRHFSNATAALEARARELAARLGLGRPVRVLASLKLRAPAAFGWLRPTVGVPGDFTARFTAPQQDVMLAHELAHLAARDPLWHLAAELVTAACWWHPLAWFARRQLRAASEQVADEASLACAAGPVTLAECLLTLGREAATDPAAALSMAGLRCGLGRRVERLLALSPRNWQAPSRARLALQTTVALLALLALALLPGCAANRAAGEAPSRAVAKWWQAKTKTPENQPRGATLLIKPQPKPVIVAGRVTFNGAPPAERNIPLPPNVQAARTNTPLKTRLHRVSPDGGLADALVYVKSGLTNQTFPTPTNPHVIRIQGYEYQPYISAVQTGQPIRWETDVNLNLHPTPTNRANREFNRALMPGRPVEATFPAPEFFLRMKDDVHPWLFGYVSVLPHPYFAVTDAEGRFRFPQPLPPGKYTLAAVHRQTGEVLRELALTQSAPVGQPLEIEFVLSQKRFTVSSNVTAYVVSVGDELRMDVYQRDNLRTQAKVQPDGTLTLPLIGEVKAAGKNISELRSAIRDAYESAHFRPAHVTVTLVQSAPPASQRLLTSASNIRPGDVLRLIVAEDDSYNADYPVRRDGSITVKGAGRVAVSGKELRDAEVAVKALLEETQLRTATVTLAFVGERASGSGASGSTNNQRFIYLAGEFLTPGALKIPDGVQPTLITSIVRSGGLTSNGDLTRAKLLRIENGQGTVEEVNVAAILSGTTPPADKPLNPGDIILVPALAPVVKRAGVINHPAPVGDEVRSLTPTRNPEAGTRIGEASQSLVTSSPTAVQLAAASPKDIRLPVPNPYAKTNSEVPFLTHSSKGAQRINRKLDEIVLPEFHFDAVPLVGVVQRLIEDAKKFDPEKQGLNFLINDVAPAAPLLDAAGNPVPVARPVALSEGLVRVSQPLRNLTLRQALDVICKTAELPTQFSVEEYAIAFIPRGPVAYYSRSFRVSPDAFIQGLQGVVGNPVLGVAPGAGNPPGAASQNRPTTSPNTGPVRATVPATVPATQRTAVEANALVRQFFQSAGVTSLGATNGSTRVTFNPENGLLLVRGTTNELRLIEQAIQKVQPLATPVTNSIPQANPLLRTNAPARLVPHSSKGAQRINAKLDEVILPEVRFDDVPLPEAVKWLDANVKKHDPEKKGVEFLINNVVSDFITPSPSSAPLLDPQGNPIPASAAAKLVKPDLASALVKLPVALTNLTLRQALDVICKATWIPPVNGEGKGLKYSVEDYAVVFSPRRPEQADLFSRIFKVDAEHFVRGLRSVTAADGLGARAEQFRKAGGTNLTVELAELNVRMRDYLRSAGVSNLGPTNGPVGTQVYLNDQKGLVFVRASLENLDIIQPAVEALNAKPDDKAPEQKRP